jgi:nucleoside-diphosphate-sugar epimerase
VRPFNCVGIGERRALGDVEISSGNVKLAMSHVVPDIIQKILRGQNPVHILGDGSQVRHYTYGVDLAKGIVLAMESDAAVNGDFNLSTAESTTVKQLVETIWEKINPNEPLNMISDAGFEYDVNKRVPSVEKAKEVLGFEATTSLSTMLDIVIPWIDQAIRKNQI